MGHPEFAPFIAPFLPYTPKWQDWWSKILKNYPRQFPSWWFQPIWKICSWNWESSPNRGENKKYLKPPPRNLDPYGKDPPDFHFSPLSPWESRLPAAVSSWCQRRFRDGRRSAANATARFRSDQPVPRGPKFSHSLEKMHTTWSPRNGDCRWFGWFFRRFLVKPKKWRCWVGKWRCSELSNFCGAS